MVPVYQEWALRNHLYQFGHPTSAAFAHAVGRFAWAGERAQTPSGREGPAAHFWHNLGGFRGAAKIEHSGARIQGRENKLQIHKGKGVVLISVWEICIQLGRALPAFASALHSREEPAGFPALLPARG